MPLLRIETNVSLSKDKVADLVQALHAAIQGNSDKPREHTQVAVSPGTFISHGGDAEAPAASGQIWALGGVDPATNKKLVVAISGVLTQHLGVDPGRFFLFIFDVPPTHIGYGGSTMA